MADLGTHERSRWAKEHRRQKEKASLAREGAKPLHDLHRKMGQSVNIYNELVHNQTRNGNTIIKDAVFKIQAQK